MRFEIGEQSTSKNKHVTNLAEGDVVAPGLSTSFGAAVTGEKMHIGYIHFIVCKDTTVGVGEADPAEGRRDGARYEEGFAPAE